MIRFDVTDGASGQIMFGDFDGGGLDAAAIPTTGDNGGSVLANDGLLAGHYYYASVVTPPTAGTFSFNWDGTFSYTGPAGWFTYQLYEDGVPIGSPVNVILQVGDTAVVPGGYPNPADVRVGTTYGANGEYVGTMAGGTTVGSVLGIFVVPGFGLTPDGKPVLH